MMNFKHVNLVDLGRVALGAVAKAAAKVSRLDSKFHIGNRLEGPWPEGPYLWLHGASLGECKMLLGLAKNLKKDLKSCPRILITTQKVEVLPFLEDSGKGVVDAAIAPADVPSAMNKFVQQVKPVGLILGENELWPGYLSTMARISIKPSIALVSGRYRRSLPGENFAGVGFASMQTSADMGRLASVIRLNEANLKMVVGGDWKLLDWVRSGAEVTCPESPQVDVAFLSVHREEWSDVEPMVKELVAKGESVVLVPRRISEVDYFRSSLREVDVEVGVKEWPEVQKGAVTLVSRFGLVREVLQQSRSAVVGGSFCYSIGIHDFWEPLQMGVATCVGPCWTGHEDIVRLLVGEGLLTLVKPGERFERRRPTDPSQVREFLYLEEKKINDSYNQLILFLEEVLK